MLNQVGATLQQVAAYLLVIVVPVGAIAIYVARRRMRSMEHRPKAISMTALDAALFMSLALIVIVTLMPSGYPLSGEPVVNLVPFATITQALTNYDIWTSTPIRSVYFNLLIFVPLGFFLAMRHGVRVAVATGLLISLLIEVCQFLFLPGRASDVDDLILNTTGALLGALAARTISGSLRRRRAVV